MAMIFRYMAAPNPLQPFCLRLS
uniref:Uncharacterized protein n=1 Tax=Anguilla anguilla TaxID=7936 RepID=A0A0E9RV86_ANGAN